MITMQATAGSDKSTESVVWEPSSSVASACLHGSHHQMRLPDGMMLAEDLSFRQQLESDLIPNHNVHPPLHSLPSSVPCMVDGTKRTSLNMGTEASTLHGESTSTHPQAVRTKKCFTKEFFTCFALSSIVIGLPVAIIIVLINLPRLSTRRDTRQQHYILLAFGFPFTLVVFVSILYAIYRLYIRIRTGPNHAKYLRSRMSWRRFSRRFRVHRDSNGHNRPGRHRHSHSQNHLEKNIKSSCNFDESDLDESDECTSCEGSHNDMSTEPKLYSLVTEVMQVAQVSKQQQQHQHQPMLSAPLHQVFPAPCNSSQSLSHLSIDMCRGGGGSHSHLASDRRFSGNPSSLG